MKLFTLHCDNGADDIKTLVFTTHEALEAKQREIINATLPPKESKASENYPDCSEIHQLLIEGKVAEAWDVWIPSTLRFESDNYCVFEHEVAIHVPAPFGKLYDIISDCIEGGRLTAGELPDDYDAIVGQLLACQVADTASQ